MVITRAALLAALERAATGIEETTSPDQEDLLDWARLWNTISFYTELQRTAEGERFHRLFVSQILPQLPAKLDMQASRGMSLHSSELDFTVGGLLEERYRYRVPDLMDS